jgi:glycosyltransferase involved in cell wall biosynthesis
MVTGGSKKREWWAKRSYQAFVEQQYSRRELLVVNESRDADWQYAVLPDVVELSPGVAAREVFVPHGKWTVGELRNIGLSEADGDWILQWDDDDWAHPRRAQEQMKWRQEDCCQTLFAQVRYSVSKNTAYTYSNPYTGIAGTILHPKTDFRYPAQMRGEDTLFMRAGWEPDRFTVLDNYTCPHLYIRFFHGGNLGDQQHVMRKYAEGKWRNRWVEYPSQWGWMARKSVAYLRQVLQSRYDITVPENVWIDVLARRNESHATDDDQIPGLRVEKDEAT